MDINKAENRIKELSEILPSATILCGDGTDQNVLKEEDLENADACITLTGVDEENVLISLYATQQNLNKVITKVDRHAIMNMVGLLGLDTVLCPRDIIANHIIRFVRAHQGDSDAGINTYYKIHGQVEVLEFTVTPAFSETEKPLRELALKDNVLIGGVIRNGEFILPGGDTCFNYGDKVLVVTVLKQITDLSEILR